MDNLAIVLLSPPVAFVIYTLLVAGLDHVMQALADSSPPSVHKSERYASGEQASESTQPPGYQPFFKVALFFAVVHLGVIVLASGTFSVTTLIYLLGLALALVALILG